MIIFFPFYFLNKPIKKSLRRNFGENFRVTLHFYDFNFSASQLCSNLIAEVIKTSVGSSYRVKIDRIISLYANETMVVKLETRVSEEELGSWKIKVLNTRKQHDTQPKN